MLIGSAMKPMLSRLFSAAQIPDGAVWPGMLSAAQTMATADPNMSHFSCSRRTPVECRQLTNWRTAKLSPSTRIRMRMTFWARANRPAG